jgi:cytochrome oxidase Cu insertion factor (SCO1/SenC/PrrC family)
LHRRVISLIGIGALALMACAPAGSALKPGASPPPVGQARPVGHQVGQAAPDFTLQTVEGRRLTRADLLAAQKPFIVYSFATW